MKPVYVAADNIISSLGFTTGENFSQLKNGIVGIRTVHQDDLYHSPVPLSRISDDALDTAFRELMRDTGRDPDASQFTRLERMILCSIHDSLKNCEIRRNDPNLIFILSTTKGNINLLENRYKLIYNHKRIFLWELAKVVQSFFGFSNTPLSVSIACISGVMGIMIASRLIRSGVYEHAVVTGADLASEFVISGFQSFQSLSPGPCKPYDLNRNGLSLGEACGTMVLSATPPPANTSPFITVSGGAVSNDANHISGPSRTGEELAFAIRTALDESRSKPEEIDYISAHGTATPYNDEMESKALKIAGLTDVPVNSLKGYWGHTLGAAGVIESVATVCQARENIILGTAVFEVHVVPEPINVIASASSKEVNRALKTASGFGGCNAAIVFQKEVS